MSTFSSVPNYRRLHLAVMDYVAYNQHMLHGMDQVASDEEARVIDAFYAVFQFVNEEFEKNKDLSRLDVKRISSKAFSKVSRIFKSKIYQDHGSSFHDKYIFIFHFLRQELKAFEKVIPHKEELDDIELEKFLATSWGWKQLEQLSKIGDRWALQTMRQLILNNHPKIFPFLIKNADFENLHSLIIEFRDHPSLKANLEAMFLKDKKGQKKVYAIIQIILSQGRWQWGEKVLENGYKHDEFAEKVIKNIFRTQKDLDHFINRFMLEQLSQDSKFGVEMFAEVISCPYLKVFLLTPQLIQMAKDKKSIHFDMLLLALAVLSYKKNGFSKAIKAVIAELESRHGLPEGHYQKILHSLYRKREELFSDAAIELSDQSKYMKADYAVARVFQLFALRDHELMHSLNNNLAFAATNIKPTAECFPAIKAVLVGSNSERAYFSRAIADLLSSYEISVYYPLLPDEKAYVSAGSPFIPLQSKLHVNIWLQDSSFIARNEDGHNFFQYPYWVEIDVDLMRSRLKQRLKLADPDRYKKLNMKDHRYPIMGRVSVDCKQLEVFDFFINTNTASTASIHNHRFQWTYNEGGNCIIGEDQQGPYALIGKDAVQLNRMLLSKELASLGFKKNEEGHWIQGAPYSGIGLKFSDEDLKKFFARDLKIADPTRIYFIEQADYHLDMVMALVGDRKIILNDSMLAYQKTKEQIQRRAKTADKLFSDASRNALRLKMLQRQAEKNKVAEDVAALDLQKNGFEVIRFAGVFQDISKDEPENHRTNLFNYLSMTTPKNKRVIIALGCSEEYQTHFRTMIRDHCEKSVDQIHFLDQKQSEALLAKKGGVHCLTKYLQELL